LIRNFELIDKSAKSL